MKTSTIKQLLIMLMLLVPLLADEEKTGSPYIEVSGDGKTAEAFPLKSTDVNVDVDGVIARVNVKQTYQNRGTSAINATYNFPASTRAAVHKMTMVLNGKRINAVVKEKQAAQKTFDEAKKAGKSASLLKQHRPNVFSMNLANVLPGDDVVIELEYTELLIPTDGVYEFVYPTVVGPRYSAGGSSEKWVGNPYLSEGKAPKETFDITTTVRAGMPISDLTCGTHPTAINWLGQEKATVFLDGSDKHTGNRDYVLKYRLQGNQIETGLLVQRDRDENYFLMMVQPPKTVTTNAIPPREYIFVVDVSGSMNGFPLDVSKELMRDLIGNLRSTDKFNVVFFAGGSQVLSDQSLPATEENLQKAINMLNNQRGGGGTELLNAMKRAVAVPKEPGMSRSIVMVSDGYISAEQNCFSFIRENLNNTNFFSFGIGTSVNRHLIEGLAKVGMGEAFVILSKAEAPATAQKFREYIESPVLTDIKVTYNGLRTYDIEPVSIPDMFAERPLLIYGKHKGKMKGSIEITGKTGTGDYRVTIPVDERDFSKEVGSLKYLWARKRIERLSDLSGSYVSPETKSEITELGLKYNLLTKYTSFVAVAEEIRTTEKAKDVTQPLALPKGVSNLAVGSGSVSSTPEPEFWMLLLGAMCVGVAYLFRRKSIEQCESSK